MYSDDTRRHAGHAHWQNIAKTKSANDQIKGRVIGKLASKIVASIKRMYTILKILKDDDIASRCREREICCRGYVNYVLLFFRKW